MRGWLSSLEPVVSWSYIAPAVCHSKPTTKLIPIPDFSSQLSMMLLSLVALGEGSTQTVSLRIIVESEWIPEWSSTLILHFEQPRWKFCVDWLQHFFSKCLVWYSMYAKVRPTPNEPIRLHIMTASSRNDSSPHHDMLPSKDAQSTRLLSQ